MPRNTDKLLARMRRTSAGFKQQDIKKVLLAHGFECRDKGKHSYFRHPEHKGLKLVVPRQRDVKPVYVQKLVKLVDTLGGQTK